MSLNIQEIRQQFPMFDAGDYVYLDSAATAQKPRVVLDSITKYYETANANPHRGMHVLAEKATIAYEEARKTVAQFINASNHEIVFTKNCTEGINLVAKSFGLKQGDSVVISILEHHSNIIPWLQLKERLGISVEWIGIDESGNLTLDDLDRALETGTVKLVSITGLSNVLGIKTPLQDIIKKAHAVGAKVLVDAAQLAVHETTDVRALDVDFLTFSGHKLYGPLGIGVLFGKEELLEQMPPFLGGGMMIENVTTDDFTSAELPQKFEAGTQPVAQAIGLATGIDWLTQYNWKDIEQHETELMSYAIEKFQTIKNLKTIIHYPLSIIHFPKGSLSFTIPNVHPHDLTEIIGRKGICMRAGHHCAQPLHEALGINASVRLSLGIYNTKEDIDRAIDEMKKAIQILKK